MTTDRPAVTRTELTALLDGNARYVRDGFPGPLPIAPARRTVILGCVDPRVDPARILDLREGDAAVIRNVGGRVTPALAQTATLLQTITRADGAARAPAGTWTFVVLQHTDCGITRLADRPDLLAPYFGIGTDEVASRTVGDPHAAVAGDVARLNGMVAPQFTVVGMVHDLSTGRVHVIDPDAGGGRGPGASAP